MRLVKIKVYGDVANCKKYIFGNILKDWKTNMRNLKTNCNHFFKYGENIENHFFLISNISVEYFWRVPKLFVRTIQIVQTHQSRSICLYEFVWFFRFLILTGTYTVYNFIKMLLDFQIGRKKRSYLIENLCYKLQLIILFN